MNNQMANDIKYVGNTQFMMPNDKKPRPIYNKNNKFTIAFKKLYREGKKNENPNLNFVYKPSTDRFVIRNLQTDMLDKRFKKTDVIKETFQKEFEIINGVATKKHLAHLINHQMLTTLILCTNSR